jgi:hypothetical protein
MGSAGAAFDKIPGMGDRAPAAIHPLRAGSFFHNLDADGACRTVHVARAFLTC